MNIGLQVLSNWEVMEKIRKLAEPIQMLYLKVVKSTNEFMRYEGEIDNAAELKTLIELLDGKIIKLGGYLESFKVSLLILNTFGTLRLDD